MFKYIIYIYIYIYMELADILNASINDDILNITYKQNYFNYTNPSTLQVLNNIAFVIDNKNNKIVIGGTTTNETSLSLDLIISRYNLNGTIDNSFGVNGKLYIDISGNSFDILNDIQIDNNGNIYVLALIENLNTSPSGEYLQPSYIILKIDGNQNITNHVFYNQNYNFEYNGESYLIIDNDNNLYLIDNKTIVYCNNNFSNITYFENPNSRIKYVLDIKTNNLLSVDSDSINEYDNTGTNVYTKTFTSDITIEYQKYVVNSDGIIYQLNYDLGNAEIKINKIIPNFNNANNPTVNTYLISQYYLFETGYGEKNIFDINIDNKGNINIIFEELDEVKNIINFILIKLDNNCNISQKITTKLADSDAVYINKKLQIDNNNNVYAFYAKNKLNYNAYEIHKFLENYNIDITFSANGIMNHDIGKFIKEPIDMYFTKDKNILIGGTTFYNNYDFLITKINTFGELDKTFGKDGLLRLDNSGNIDIFFNIIEIADEYYISGLSKNNNIYELIFIVINNKGNIIKKLYTNLAVNNLYAIKDIRESSNINIFYSDIDDDYFYAIYDFKYDLNTIIKNFNLGKFNMPQFLIPIEPQLHLYHLYSDFRIIFDSYKDNNLHFIKIYMYYFNPNTKDFTLSNTASILLNDYYKNINSVKKIIAFNKEFFSDDIYLSIILNVSNKDKFLLLNGKFSLDWKNIKIKFILNTEWNNNSGYISNTNYNIIPSNYKFATTVVTEQVEKLFSKNLTITKIDIDSSLDIILGGTYETDFSGNKLFFMKLQNNGYIKNIVTDFTDKRDSRTNLNTFIITDYNEIIYSSTPINYISTYINSSNLLKLYSNFYKVDLNPVLYPELKFTFNYNNKDYSYEIQNKYLTIIEIDKEKRIYKLLYNLSNYPNTLLTIDFSVSNFNIYKYNDITRFLLSNNNILLRNKLK